MTIRSTIWPVLVFCGCWVSGTHPTGQQSSGDQLPAFRSGVELVTVEVGVLDKQGRPVRGLKPEDFNVTVDGRPRRVATAEFVDASRDAGSADAPELVPISTNEGAAVGRLVTFIVDGHSLEMGDARYVAAVAAPFFSRLREADRSALVSLPVGQNIGFTWAHDRVREGLLRAATSGGAATTWEFGSLSDVRDIATRGSFALREIGFRECGGSSGGSPGGFGGSSSSGSSPVSSPGQSPPPSGGSPSGGSPSGGGGSPGGQGSTGSSASPPGDLADRCMREIQSQAEMTWGMVRSNSLSSLAALRQAFSGLGRIQGDKTVVLISGGWPLDQNEETSALTSIAAEAVAARITVFALYIPRETMSASRRTISMSHRNDEGLYRWPLENLATMTGGRAFRADAGAEGIFDRLARELAGYYRIGVEKDPVDTGASGRRLKVQVKAGGVSVRAREIFDVATYPDRDWAARLGSALESPMPATALGVRATSYLASDSEDPGHVRLVLAGYASRLQPGNAVMHLIVRDLEGRRIVAGEHRLGPVAGSTAAFAAHVRVPAGSYMVRLAVQDGGGRVGSVDHRVDARPVSLGGLSVMGPMLAGIAAAGQGDPHLAVDGILPDERLALEVALQGGSADLAGADVTFEIASDADGPALIQPPAKLSRPVPDGLVVAHAVADAGVLPPGQYLARVKVKSGTAALGEVRRGFAVLERPVSAAPAEASAPALAAGTPPASLRPAFGGRATAVVPGFAVEHVLAPHLLDPFLARVAARPDAAAPAAAELLIRARAGKITDLTVSEAQAAQTPVGAFLRGLTLLGQNKVDLAARDFRSAMRASPDFYPAMVYLGACYAAAGNDKEAAAIWRTALIRERDVAGLHLLLADALLRQGTSEAALQIARAARARWPDDDGVKQRFVIAALVGGDPGAGLQALDDLAGGGGAEEPVLTLALFVLYEALTSGRVIEGPEQDRDRMIRLADAYRTRGGPSLALVEAWRAAVERRAKP